MVADIFQMRALKLQNNQAEFDSARPLRLTSLERGLADEASALSLFKLVSAG
jgi:hypothetical protein